jgi:cytochrome c oxidase assembly protein subunit 15
MSRARPLAAGFTSLAALSYGLIVLGSFVRANGAGLACPDWPLCFGEFVPEFDFKVAFEWGHRLAAGFVSLLFVGLSIVTLLDPRTRKAVGPLLAVAALLLSLQVLLGALTVWQLLVYWSVTSHLMTGNAFAVSLALTARVLHWLDAPPPPVSVATPLRAWVTATSGLLFVQMVLGGLVSSQFAGQACPEWPTCFEGQWFPTFSGVQGIHVLHRLCAYALLVSLAACAWQARGKARVGLLLAAALAIGLAQVAVGVANVLLRIPVEVTGLHSALAAALVLTLACSAQEVWRRS